MRKILHIRNSDIYGSPERLIIGQMRHLTDFDSSCATFVLPGNTSPFLNQLRQQNLISYPIPSNGPLDRTITKKIRTVILENKIDLIVSHDYKANFYGYLANRPLKLPHVGYYHGRTEENLKVKLYNFVDSKILPRLNRVITVSNATAGYLNELSVPIEKISVIYNALDISPDSEVPTKPTGNPPVIGVIGRLSHEKGVHIFLKAMALIIDRIPTVEVRIFGDGPEGDNLKKQCAELGLDTVVRFMGFETDLDKIYKPLDMIVIPSLSEGHPLIILEAWKHGIGIVAAKAGGIPEVMDHNRTGLLTEVGDPTSLAEMIASGLDDINRIKQFGQNGFYELKNRFSYTAQAAELHKVYTEVISG